MLAGTSDLGADAVQVLTRPWHIIRFVQQDVQQRGRTTTDVRDHGHHELAVLIELALYAPVVYIQVVWPIGYSAYRAPLRARSGE